MSNWPCILRAYERAAEPAVLVSVVGAKGSTPRDQHAHMLVTASRLSGTIGGGQLEYRAVQRARLILGDSQAPDQILELPLGPEIGQCCGGHAALLLDRLDDSSDQWLAALAAAQAEDRESWLQTEFSRGRTTRSVVFEQPEANPQARGAFLTIEPLQNAEFDLYLFGAGHVGKAVAGILSGLPGKVTWIDSRAAEFPAFEAANITKYITDDPAGAVQTARAGAFYLVMSHSHQLDFEICEQILKRQDFRYAGLIGSMTKRSKFEKRLALRNIGPQVISRLACPIGVAGISGKTPGEIAVSVCAEILQINEEYKNMVADNEQAHKLNESIM